jgi:membrane glycosyltransferase
MTNKLTITRTLFALTMLIGLTSAFAGTAQADEWRNHERDAHAWHWRHVHHYYGPHYIVGPNVVYAPPVIVAPPTMIAMPSPGLSIVIPLNFR